MLWSFRPTLLLGLLWLFGISVVVAPNTKPDLTDDEKAIYRGWNRHYENRYWPRRINPRRIPYLMHIVAAHPDVEQKALEHAHISSFGPYAVANPKGALWYAMTRIPGDAPIARNWNLRQKDTVPWDVNVLWRVNRKGPKMLRFDLWDAGARGQQIMSMQGLIEQARRQAWF